MKRRTVLTGLGLAGVLPGMTEEILAMEKWAGPPEGSGPVYELRVYTAAEGKLPELLARFREHTTKLFERHGIQNVAYWTAIEASSTAPGGSSEPGPNANRTLVYILKYPSREEARASWKAFQDDPEWQQVRRKSEENGKLVEKVDSTFMTLTDFSAKL
jgi:hypothetical protein